MQREGERPSGGLLDSFLSGSPRMWDAASAPSTQALLAAGTLFPLP